MQTDVTTGGSKKSLAGRIARLLFGQRESGLFLLILLLVVVLSALRPTTFFSSENLFNILKQVSLVSIVAVGQTLVMVSGGINLGLSGVMLAFFIQAGMNPVAAVVIGVVSSVLAGLLNGVFITKLRLPPFIVTLGVAKIVRGVMYVVTRGYPIPVYTKFIIWFGNGYFGPVPVPTVFMLLVVALGVYILLATVFGNRLKAIGGNELAARLSGINIDANKIYIYALAGLLAGIAGVIMVGRVNAGNPNSGLNFDLDSIAATIIGGTSLAGGEGTVLGTLLGAVLLGVIANGLVLLNVSMYWQTIVAGVIIIGVCALDTLTNARRKAG
jgi:ribose transport system permease protein